MSEPIVVTVPQLASLIERIVRRTLGESAFVLDDETVAELRRILGLNESEEGE